MRDCSRARLSQGEELMIYEVRTYTLRPGGAVAEFEERFHKRLALREKHSKS